MLPVGDLEEVEVGDEEVVLIKIEWLMGASLEAGLLERKRTRPNHLHQPGSYKQRHQCLFLVSQTQQFDHKVAQNRSSTRYASKSAVCRSPKHRILLRGLMRTLTMVITSA